MPRGKGVNQRIDGCMVDLRNECKKPMSDSSMRKSVGTIRFEIFPCRLHDSIAFDVALDLKAGLAGRRSVLRDVTCLL